MKISVVTATYNRDNLLPNLYNSLKKNYKTYKDFEWIVVDDGSQDDTKSLVKKWIKEAKFDIKYIYQKNGGKMSAINNGMKSVTGDIVIEVDSDDYLLDNGLKIVNNEYEKLKDDKVAGIIFKRILGKKDTTTDSSLDGKVFTLFDIHNKYGYDFDMTLTFKTSVRTKYEYELVGDEKFITEASTYYKIDQDYDGLLFRDINLVSGEYMEDGYSVNINRMFKRYPYGYRKFFNECLTYVKKDTNKKRKLYFIKHYILFSYLTGTSMFDCIKEAKRYKLLITSLVIPGYIKSSKF